MTDTSPDELARRCATAEAYAATLADELLATRQSARNALDASVLMLDRLQQRVDDVTASRDELADVLRRVNDHAPHLVAAAFAARETPLGGAPE